LCQISNPLLLDTFPEYLNSAKRILFVGQQTNGWGNYLGQHETDDNVEELMALYRKFHLGEKYLPAPFLNACRTICRRLNPGSSDLSFIWTNLVKVDQCGRRPCQEVENRVSQSFPVLIDEIGILNPDAVIFFSGPNYDSRISAIFGLNFDDISQQVDNFELRRLALLVHRCLPAKSYRTYHPSYLRRKGLEGTIVDKICDLING